jgi:anaerobic carbon-monoxide dehydrogenase iron sulfur subunit
MTESRRQIVLDTDRCIGCRSCAAACFLGHMDTPALRYEDTAHSCAMPMVCRQCEDSPCTAACPNEAMYVDENGIIRRSLVRCTGCTSCVIACPFGVLNTELSKGQVAKCDLCPDRTPEKLPRCVAVCPSGALRFLDVVEGVPNAHYQLLSGRMIAPTR